MDVTLIVKASNQQCEDLTIKCQPSWTIRKLKGHLTEVYPGKPSSDEQKLIYSGQLLSDTVILKDVLRQYDGQQAHTVHLVCTPKNNYYGNGGGSGANSKSSKGSSSSKMATNPTTSPSAGGSTNGSSSSGSGAVSVTHAGNNSVTGGSSRERNETTAHGVGSDGMRQRTLLQTRPGLRTLPGPPPYMEQTAAVQSLVQQTYMQYLNQYINLINEQAGVNTLYSATGMPMAAGTATPLNPLTGSPMVPSVPFVPMAQPVPMAGGAFPNFAYYPCMSAAASHVGGLPSASSIPTTIASSTSASGSSSVLPGAAPGNSYLPSSSIPSTSGGAAAGGQQTPTSPLPGAAKPSLPSATDTGASSSSASATTVAAAEVATAQVPGADGATAVPAQGAPQDGTVAEAAAPARARRFPNIVVEEQENNDWLDVFFSMCRVGILMTVIYLYSSPMRCLTVLIIGVMLYLKKHLDRVYQAIDRRMTRLPPLLDGNGGRPQQPQPVAAQPNVPDQQANQAQRPGQDPRGALIATEEQPTAGSSTADASPKPESAETENDLASASSSAQSSAVPLPRTGPASRTAEATVAATAAVANTETEPLLERPSASGSDPTSAEQPAAEGQRMTFNDMTSFLGTLVITFFTSIIPDTPAA